ncbi:MAG: rod shape-determining protein MreD [Sphingorhabdus sp.]
MKSQILATSRKLLGPGREYESRIERHQSPMKMLLIPIFSVMTGSMVTALPIFSQSPLLPPMGYMVLLAWRLMRPGIWPAWVGLPFGLFDDLYSGQPFGSAAFLWSLTMLVIEIIDSRAVWRDHWQDWFLATVAITLTILGGVAVSGLAYWAPELVVVAPQLLIAILTFPLVVRVCARLDNWRLAA